MRNFYLLSAAVAIAALWSYRAEETCAHGPAIRITLPNAAAQSLVAAQIARQNQQLAMQQQAQLLNSAVAAQVVAPNPTTAALGSQLAVQNQVLSLQQGNLIGLRQSSSVASQLVATNNAINALAQQVSAQNPQLSPQQALLAATREVGSFVPQVPVLPTTSTTTQSSLLSPATTGVGGFVPNLGTGAVAPIGTVTPSLGFGNGTLLPQTPLEDFDTLAQTSLALQKAGDDSDATAQHVPATLAHAVKPIQGKHHEAQNRVEHVAAFYAALRDVPDARWNESS